MKNFLFLLLIVVSSTSYCFSQTINDYIQSVDLIDMGDFELEYNSPYCFFDGAIYYVAFDENDEVSDKHFLVKKTPTSTDSTEFMLWNLIKMKSFDKITVDSNFVILEDQFITYYYLRTPEGLKNIFFSTHKEGAEQIKIYGNSIYRSHSSIQGSALWEKTQTWVEVFNLENKTHRIFDFPNPLGIEYMYYQPRNLIEFTKEYVYVMDVLDYKIKIYNYEGKLVDSIFKPFKDNKIIPTPINDLSKEELFRFDIMSQRVRKHDKIYNENWKNAKLMSRISLLNDSTLLICYSEPEEEWPTNVFDVWKFDRTKKNWYISKEGLKVEKRVNEEREGIFELKRIPIYNNYSCGTNTLITQKNYSYDVLKLKTYKTWKEFHSLSEDFLKKSEVPNTIFIYTLQF